MATSRTGTGQWKRIRQLALQAAMDAGQTRCPLCGVTLDWEYSRRPNSPEVDHIVPHSKGGTDDIANLRVICRFDNQSRGGRSGNPRGRTPARSIDYQPHGTW